MIGVLAFANPPRRGRVMRRKVSIKIPRRRRVARRHASVVGKTAREGKEINMARSRVRRRGRRKVAKLSVRRSRRRARRNSGNPSGFIAIPRLLRRRKGRFAKTGKLVRHNPRRRSRSRRRRNPGNPWIKTHHRRGGRVRRHWARKARRNPGGRRRMRARRNPIEGIMDLLQDAFSMDTLTTVMQTGLGFGGSIAGSKLIYNQLIPAANNSFGRVATTLGVNVLGTVLLGWIGGSQIAARSFAGGMLATAWQGLTELVKSGSLGVAGQWIPTLGDAETDDFRRAIEREVLREIRGEGMNEYLVPAGSSEYLTPAGSQAYMTASEGDRAALGTYLTQRETIAAEAGVGHSEFGGKGSPEQF